MLCRRCRAARTGVRGACEVCAGPLWQGPDRARKPTLRAFQENDVVRKRVQAWRHDGMLDEAASARLLASLDEEAVLAANGYVQVAVAPEPAPVAPQPAVTALPVTPPVDAPRPARTQGEARASVDAAHERSIDAADEHDTAAEASGALFASRSNAAVADAAPLAGALGALALLDAEADGAREGEGEGASPGDEVRSFVFENVGWFVGVLLVLAGSVYGVREAWRTLGGVARHAVVALALLGYHAGFTGLARLLSSRSRAAGAVLSAVAVGLLPMVFASLAALVGVHAGAGVALAAVATGVGFVTTRAAGRRFGLAQPSGLALAVLPALWAMLPLATLPGETLLRFGLPFVGAASFAVTLARSRPVRAWPSVWSSLYVAVASLVLAFAGAPDVDDVGLWLSSGGAPLATLALFAAAIAWSFSEALGAREERELHPRAAPTGEVLSLAVLASSVVSSLYVVFSADVDALTRGALWLSSGAAALSTVAFARASLRHPGAAHASVWVGTLSAVLVARAVLPSGDASRWWFAASALGPAASLIAARVLSSRGDAASRAAERGLVAWSWVFAPFTVLAPFVLDRSLGAPRSLAGASAGLVIAVAAALSGGFARSLARRHYLAGVMLLAALACLFDPTQGALAWGRGVVGSAVLLGLLGLAYTSFAARDGSRSDRENTGERDSAPPAGPDARDRSAYDDLSLACALAGAYFVVRALPTPSAPLLSTVLVAGRGAGGPVAPGALDAIVLQWSLCAPAALVLLARAQRDRSRLVSAAAAFALAAPVWIGPAQHGSHALVAGAIALLSALVALGRGREGLASDVAPAAAEATARRVFDGALLLPFAARPRALFFDGFALLSLVAAVASIVRVLVWMSAVDPSTRAQAVAGAALVALTGALWFLAPSLRWMRAQGHAITLAWLGAAAAVAGVANRIGRPLAPAAVSLRFAVLGTLLWLAARLLSSRGAWLAQALSAREREGRRYALVPYAGLVALAVLSLFDAVAFGSLDVTRTVRVVPPSLWAAGALLVGLLAFSTRRSGVAWVSLVALVPAAAALGAQRALFGSPLAPLDPPGGRWMFAERLASVQRAEVLEYGARAAWLDPQVYLPAGETDALVWQRGLVGVSVLLLAYALAHALDDRTRGWLVARWNLRVPAREASVTEGARDGASEATGEGNSGGPPGYPPVFFLALGLGAFAVFAASFVQTSLGATAVLLASALLLAAARSRPRAPIAAYLALGLSLAVHAYAQSRPAIDEAIGPSLGLLAALVVLAGAKLDLRRIGLAMQLGRVLFVGALVYALAAGGVTTPMLAAASVLRGAFESLGSGAWLAGVALGLTALAGALGAAFAAYGLSRRAEPADRALGASAMRASLWALAASLLFALRYVRLAVVPPDAWEAVTSGTPGSASPPGLLLQQGGGLLALTAAVVALASHVASRALAPPRRSAGPTSEASRDLSDETRLQVRAIAARGLALGRDVGLVVAGLCAAAGFAIVRDGLPPDPSWALGAALAALATAMVVSAHAAWREASGRHVYFVQASVVGAYAAVRALVARGLDPAIDALAALGFGFVLVGVTVLARRARVAPVADATRRFAAWLPVLASLVLGLQASNRAALVAAVAGALYGSLAIAERSRWLGTLAGVFVNGALLLGALANGLDGVEVYLAPLGLFVLTLGQLFRTTLGVGARTSLRVVGGLLLYLPAGLATALQLGDAATGTYAVVFGAGCLVGIATGAVLRIRAYLVLGALFLTLDVVANLAYAGLRDHRVGFAVLSSAGLLVLAAMVFTTLQRDRVRAVLARVRGAWRKWD